MASGLHHKYKVNDFSSISCKAFPDAVPFAEHFGVRLILLHVIEPFWLLSELSYLPPEVDNAGGTAMKGAMEILAELCQQTLGARCLSQASVRMGVPWQEIKAAARESARRPHHPRDVRSHRPVSSMCWWVAQPSGSFAVGLVPGWTCEQIVGALPSFDPPPQMHVIRREDGSWLVDASLELEELKQLLGVKQTPGEENEPHETLSAFVLHQLKRVPREGDYFEWGGLRFEVADVDRHRPDKILIQPLKSSEPKAPAHLNRFIL